MSDYGKIEVEVEVLDYDEGNGDETIYIPVAKMIERLTTVLASVPETSRPTALLKIWAYGEYAHGYVNVIYTRDPTEEEISRWDEQEAHSERELEARERAQFERLRAKFGN